MRITDEKDAFTLFCSAAETHAEATEAGDSQVGNAVYQQVLAALRWLELNQATHLLHPLLTAPKIGAQLWAASFLLLQRHALAEETLRALATRKDIHGFSAQMMLGEWQAGRLKPLVQ